jgi:hypothetical protein
MVKVQLICIGEGDEEAVHYLVVGASSAMRILISPKVWWTLNGQSHSCYAGDVKREMTVCRQNQNGMIMK